MRMTMNPCAAAACAAVLLMSVPGVLQADEANEWEWVEAYMAEFVDRVNRNGGVVAIDINLHPDGSFDRDRLDVLKAIGLRTGTLKASSRVEKNS